jgi:hypothetical protein
MKVLIFENEFLEIEPIFEALKKDFEDFNYVYFANSQGLKPFDSVIEYDRILVDLKLSDKTKMEGFDILDELIKLTYNMKHVAIITGHTDYISRLRAKKELELITVMEKPLSIDELERFLGL